MVTRPLKAGIALSRSRLLRIAALFAIVALFVSACGGSSNKNASTGASGSSATATGGSSAVAPTGGSALTGSSSSSITGGPSGANAAPSGSTGAVAAGSGDSLPISNDVSTLKSYRWELTLEGKGSIVAQLGPDLTGSSGAAPPDSVSYDIKGAYIQPDKAQMELDTGGVSLKQTVVGTQEWTTVGGITQGPTEVGASAVNDLGLPGFFDVGDVFRDVQGFDCSGSQSVNGVDATVCSADKSDYDQMAAGIAGMLDNTGVETVNDFSLKIYIAKDGGYVVKTDMTMSGVGTDNKQFSLAIHLNVTDVNNVSDITP